MDIKLKLVAPYSVPPEGIGTLNKLLAARRRVASPGTVIDFVTPQDGPQGISNMAELFLSSDAVLPEVLKAPEEGYSAVIVDCTCDQLYPEIVKRLSIPLVPTLHASLHLAAMLGNRFSIITPMPGQGKIYPRLVELYGFSRKLVSVQERVVDFFSGKVEDEELISIFVEEGQVALQKGAQCIVLGCTGLTLDRRLQERLGVPVLAPGDVAVKTAEMFVKLGLRYR